MTQKHMQDVTKNKLTELFKGARFNFAFAAITAVAIISVGYVLVRTNAAGFFAASEAEQSSLSGNAHVVNDSTASGGSAISFNSPAPSPSPSPTPPPPSPPPGSTTCPLPKYPDASCTGVPAGTVLSDVYGDYTVSTDNATVTGLTVHGCIFVNAVGVTIKNSEAQCITTSSNTRARDPANPRLTIQDSELDCGDSAGTTAIGDRNINVYRVNIHGCENGFDMDSDAIIKDSYIHDLFNAPDAPGSPHTDGLQSAVGSNLLIDHNTVYGFDTGCHPPNNGSCNGTSALNVFNAPSGPTVHDTTVSNNLLAGGSFALYCPRVTTVNFKVLNNHFSTVYGPKIGEYGPSADCSNETLSGNVYHESGAAITLD